MSAWTVSHAPRRYDGLWNRWEEVDGVWTITAVYDATAGTPPARRPREAITVYESTAPAATLT